jgi:hypothetical protein
MIDGPMGLGLRCANYKRGPKAHLKGRLEPWWIKKEEATAA